MKVYFLNINNDYPNQYPPIGLLSLAAVCEEKGHEVFLYDLGAKNANYEEFIYEFCSIQPDVICCSVYTTNFLMTLSVLDHLKKIKSNLIIIVGGPHVSALPGSLVKNYSFINYEVIGEGEESLIDLLGGIIIPSSIKGIVYRESFGSIAMTEKRERIKDLRELPLPKIDLIKRFIYSRDKFSMGKRVGAIITSRGCPYNCTFCNKAVFGNTYTRKSTGSVIAEILNQIEVLGIDEINFVDDLFCTDKKWINNFISLLRCYNIKLPWKCTGRVNSLDEYYYEKIKQAGCFMIQFGVETGDETILKSIKKRIKHHEVESTIAACKRVGLNTATYYIIGHPGETHTTAKKTIDFAKHINTDVAHFFVLVPFPGTENYNLVDPELRDDWSRIRYYHNYGLPISLCEISPEELKKYELSAKISYYSRILFLKNCFRKPYKLSLIKISAFVWFTLKRVFK